MGSTLLQTDHAKCLKSKHAYICRQETSYSTALACLQVLYENRHEND